MMFIVGIDVAKRSHEVSIITSEGQTVQRAFSISNNCTGYNCLMEKIRKLTNVRSEIVFAMESTAHGFNKLMDWVKNISGADDVVFGMEATGHYWLALYTHLHKDGYPVVVLNPIQTDAMREMFIRKTKTDAKDSLFSSFRSTHFHIERTGSQFSPQSCSSEF